MNPASLTVKQKIANGFVIFTAIWSSAIMPVIPSYAKMLDNNDLPTLGSDNIIAEDNTERLVAEYSKTLGTFLSQKKKTKDLSDMAQNYARNKAANEATKEIEGWLSKAGNAKLSINLDKKLSVKNSQLDWLIPWYDQPDTLLFTQHSVHRNDGRLQTNNGIGLRRFYEKNTLGINAFIDHDLSQYHTRAGVGVEYWQDYLKVNANTYFALSSWKSTSELNHDFNAKPANGWDIQAEGWLPDYPHLGGNLKYEQYYGDSVALFGKTKRQKNPKAATIGAHWTPFPLLTLNANHKIGSQGKKETQAKIQFTWTLGKSLAHHLDPTKVADARRLSGNRYDFVERNNNIILDYQKKTLLHLSLPAKIQGETGQAISLVKSFSSKYPLKQIEWQAPELLAAGGSISSTDQTATVILPTYKTANTAEAAQKLNRYRLQGTAFDTKGNTSPVAETLIEITNAGVISISPNDIKSQGKGLANGNDVNSINVVVKDSHGNVVPSAKVVFILPNALTLAAQKTKTGAATQPEFHRELRKKMQAMKVAKPWEYTTTTNSKGEAQVQFTSQVAGTYEVGAYTGSHQPVKAQVVFKSDITEAHIRHFIVTQTGAVADGNTTNSVKVYVTDNNGNPITDQEVLFSATHAKVVDKAITNEDGIVEVTLTSFKAGVSEITASVSHHNETQAVEFVSGKTHRISILEVDKVNAGRESRALFQLLDNQNNPIINANNDVTVTIDKNTESTQIWPVDVDKGIYATTISAQQAGEHKIQIAIGKVISLEHTFTTRVATSVKSVTPDGKGLIGTLGVVDSIEIHINPDRTTFKSGEPPLIMVTLKDIFGNAIEDIDSDHIHLGNMKGKDLDWRDDGHSDYALNLSLTTLGDIDITANVNGIFSPKTVLTVSHNTDISTVENIVVTPNTKTPNAGDKPTIKVELTDKNGNPVKDVQNIEVTIGNDKHTLPVTPNTDGSYTAELPAQQSGDKQINVSVNGKDSNKETLNVQPPAPISPNNQGQQDQKGVVKTLEITTGSTSGLKSGDTLEVTVTATDTFGNGIKGLDKNNLHLGSLKGDTLNWTDNGDGSYTAQVPLKDLGNIDVTASLNGVSSQKTDITVGNATGNNSVQNIVVTPNTKTPNAGDKPTIKVELTDKNGNPVKDVQNIEVTIGNDKHTLPVTPNTDGSYTAELPAQQSGDKQINVSVNGKDSNKETLNVQPPAPISPNNQGQQDQKGVVKTLEITTGSTSGLKSGDTLEVTVTATDTFGNGIKGLDKNNLHLGSLKGDTLNWTDNGDGSYTAQVPLKDLGNIDVTASLNGVSSQKTDITVGKATGNNSVQNIVVTPNTKTPNAGDKPTIKVELTDKNGNPVKDIQNIEVTIGNDKHTLPVTPNTNGSYTAELPAQQSGDKQINVSVNGKDSNKETLNVQPPAPISPNNQGQQDQKGVVKTLEITTGSTSGLKSGDTLEVTVTATDTFGNGIKGLDKNNLHLGSLKGDTLNWTDNGDGSYTAQVPLKDLGNIDVTASLNGVSSQKTDITVGKATGNNSVQNIVVTPNTKTPNAGDKPTIKVELTDKNGNPVKDVQNIEVTIGNDKHTLPVTPNTDGSYTAELPALQAGNHQITATVNGQSSVQDTLDVKKPAPISPNNSSGTGNRGERGVINNIAIKTSDITNLQSGDNLNITVTIIDAFNNPLTAIDPSNIILDGYKASSLKWLDNGDGTYTTPLLLMQTGTSELVASINGHKSPLITITVGNTTDINKVANVELDPITPSEAGEPQTITVKVTDKYQHPVTAINKMITANINSQSAPIILTESLTQKGTYTGTLPAQKTGKYTVEVTTNNKTASKPWDVKTAATITAKEKDGSGTANQRGVVKTVTLVSSPINDLKSGQSLQLTVALKDTFGNPLEGISGASLQLKHQQPSVSSVNWVDLRNGDYTTILPLTKIGQDTLTVKVNQITTSPLNINVGNATGTTQIHKVDIKNIEKPAAGETSAITLVLSDANNQPITGVNNNAVVSINGAEELLKITETVNKGTYTGTLSGQKSGDHKVIVTVGGVKSTESTLTVNAPVPTAVNHGGKSGSHGVMSRVALAVSPAKNLKSGDTLKLTATLEDAFGNPLTGIDLTQSLTHKQAGQVTWTAQKDGTYTANLVLTQLGQDHLFITANKIQSPTIAIDVKSQLGINAIHKIDIHDIANAAAGAQSTFTVVLNDDQGNPVNGIQHIDATIDKQKLPNIVVTQQADGRYSGKLPGQQSGSYDVVISANKQSSTAKTLTVAQPDTVTATANGGGTTDQRGVVSQVALQATPNTKLTSGDTVQLMVALKDSFNNPLKGVDSSSIAITHQQSGAVTWKDNADGTYTANLLLSQLGADTLKVTVNSISQSQAIDVKAPQGKSAVHKVELKATNKTFKVGDSVELQLTLTDSHGNGVEKVQTKDIQLEHNLSLVTKLTWLEKGAGIYTTTIPLHKQGKNAFVSQVNNRANTPFTISVSALTDPTQVKAVELKASTNQLTVGSQTELTLTLMDQWNNGVEGITAKDITINDAHIKKNLTGLSWISKGNGIYTASTAVSIAGIHSLRATVNQIQSHNVLINALPSTNQSHINKVQLKTNLSTITAGSKVTLSLKVTDADNNPVIHLNNNMITLTDGSHKISTVWDEDNHGLGLYSTNILLSDVKTHNLTAGIGQFTDTASVTVNSPVGNDAVKTITISPVANSDAGQPSSLSIGLTDQYKNPVKNVSSGDITVTVNGQKQDIIFMEKNVLNKYIAQLPASKAGRYQIMVEANGQSETVDWDVNPPKEIPITSYDKNGLRGSLETILITHSAKNNTANSGDNVTLTVGLKDKFDNKLTSAASSLKLLTNLQSASAWKELSGGLYTQELTMNKLRNQPIQVVADKILSDKLELNVNPAKGENHVHKTTLETNEGTIEAGHDVRLTLALTDKVNNSVIDVDTNAIQLTNNGKTTVVTWANPQDGLYTTKLRLDTVGNYQFKATVNNQPSRIQTIEVNAPSGQAKVAKAQLVSNIASLDAGKDVELTLTLKDQYDNLVIGVNGADIALKDSHTTEVIDNSRIAWRMASEGVYKASLPLTLIGNHMLTATVNHQSASTSPITVNSLKGTANVNQITLTAAQNAISAGETTTLTLSVLDSFGNEVDDVLTSDISLTNADAQITPLVSWTKVPSTIGTYVASVQLDKVMAHTLIAKVNGQTKTTIIHVNPLKGFDNVTAVSLQTPSTTEVDEKNKLTLTLTDRFGNGVVEVKPSHITLTSGSVAQVVTWTEGKNGVYRTELALSQVGNQSITVKVNNATETKAVRVNSPAGKDNVASIQLTATTTSVLPNTPVTLTLTLKDQHGNSVKNVRSSDISLSDSHISESFTSPNWAEDSQQIGVYTVVVNLKKTAEHTLTAKVNNLEKGTKITVQPFTGVQQVNRVELSIDKNAISIGGKVNFTLTAKDIYGNNVLIQATDIRLQNANGAINQPTWQQHGMQFKGELTLSTSGSYVITAKVGDKTSSLTNLMVQSGKPVFATGKSEFSVSSHELDEGSNTNIAVKLVLKDASGNPISGKQPQLTATMGNIDSVMNETALGEYTGAFNNSTLGKADIKLAPSSIGYTGSIPPITVVTYGQTKIITIENPHTFSVNDGFPNTGFVGASFQITVPIGQPTDYDWSVDIDWLSIDDKGVVTMLRKPTPIDSGNAMIPIFKGEPKPHTGYKRTVDYRFTLKKWYSHIGKVKSQNIVNACIPSGRVIKQKDMSESRTVHRKTGDGVMNEWGYLMDYDEFDRIEGWAWAYHDSEYKYYNISKNEVNLWPIDKIKDIELSTICVEDLK